MLSCFRDLSEQAQNVDGEHDPTFKNKFQGVLRTKMEGGEWTHHKVMLEPVQFLVSVMCLQAKARFRLRTISRVRVGTGFCVESDCARCLAAISCVAGTCWECKARSSATSSNPFTCHPSRSVSGSMPVLELNIYQRFQRTSCPVCCCFRFSVRPGPPLARNVLSSVSLRTGSARVTPERLPREPPSPGPRHDLRAVAGDVCEDEGAQPQLESW